MPVLIPGDDPWYDLDSDIGKVRLEVGDTVEDNALFHDSELQYFLDVEGTVQKAAARACETLAARYARYYDFQTDDQRFQRSQMAKAYADKAKELRARGGGVTTIAPTRIDGHSVDIPNDQISSVGEGSSGRVRAGYFDPDIPY